jgi:hypothetical protein
VDAYSDFQALFFSDKEQKMNLAIPKKAQ